MLEHNGIRASKGQERLIAGIATTIIAVVLPAAIIGVIGIGYIAGHFIAKFW